MDIDTKNLGLKPETKEWLDKAIGYANEYCEDNPEAFLEVMLNKMTTISQSARKLTPEQIKAENEMIDDFVKRETEQINECRKNN